MKRAMIYALAAGLTLGTGSLAYGQAGSGRSQAPGSQPGMAGSPSQSQAQKIPEAEVVAALEQHGFTDVRDVKQQGDKITAKAKKDGKQQAIEIDTRTGMMRSGG